MKAKYILLLTAFFAICLSGCKKGAEYNPALYFTGTDQTPEVKFVVDGPSSMGVSITSSVRVGKDINVNVKLAPELVADYNARKKTAYEYLPDGSFNLSATNTVIKSGVNISDAIQFSITSLADFREGVTYIVPITITGTDGDIPVLESSRTLYLIIKRTIITQAASLAGNRYFSVPTFMSDASLAAVPNLTLECRVLVNSFQTANPFITSVMGIEETFLLRFGDVSIPNNKLQLAAGQVVGAGKYPVTSNAAFSTGQWHHIAAVYNGSTMSLYVDGVLDNYTDAAPGGINLTSTWEGGFLIGRSAGSRYLNGYISEARVWSKALTANELQNNLCYVDPASAGLLAYWRFNGTSTGNDVPDLTGHGHTAIGNNTLNWILGVRCP